MAINNLEQRATVDLVAMGRAAKTASRRLAALTTLQKLSLIHI